MEWLLSRHQIHSAAGLTAKAGLVEPKSSWRSTLLRSASPKYIFCGHFLFPGSFILEYFFRLQQGCHLRSLERRHQCFDRVWKKLLKHYRVFHRSVYHVTNKCYNGRLYPCQCLEFGYLIRFDSSQFFVQNQGYSLRVHIFGSWCIQVYSLVDRDKWSFCMKGMQQKI